MIPLKPSLVFQSPSVGPSSYVQAARPERRPTPSYAHISFFRSALLDMQIYSPSIKVVPGQENSQQSLPVFGEQDKIEGKVMLDPSCSQNGRLMISLEGSFEYTSVKEHPDDQYSHNAMVSEFRHVFLSSSASIPVMTVPEHRSTIREALIRKRPSTSSLRGSTPACRCCDFNFELPHGSRPDEVMPSTFFSKTNPRGPRRQLRVEELKVSYRIKATWEPSSDGSGNPVVLEAPVLFQPDADFQFLDGPKVNPQSWLEIPLIPERPLPFSCAVTLPRPHSFSRCSSIPYFVVFATNTRSPCLVREIATDASIVVSLVRKITITPQRRPQSPTLPDTPPASDESDGQVAPFAPRSSRLLRRSIKSPSRSCTREGFFSLGRPLPEPPQEAFSAVRTLHTEVFIGFPKRPRVSEPSHSTPNGLFKGKVPLSKDMMPSVDWPGISVKYYLDVSVLASQDDVRARVPVRVY